MRKKDDIGQRCVIGHFEGVLNKESSFNVNTTDGIPMMTREEMCGPPASDEMLAA